MTEQCTREHQLLNQGRTDLCARRPQQFSYRASVPLPDAEAAAREAERAVRTLGAVGLCIAANVEGVNPGEFPLDPLWQAALNLDIPIFIHPVQAASSGRIAKFALTQIAQYTFDTTLCVGSLIFSGVLDRFPKLRLILSHGGGGFSYLLGRFNCMHGRMDRKAQAHVTEKAPSEYLGNFYFDSLLHDPKALRYLVDVASADKVVLGSDYSFPPADHDPVGIVRKCDFSQSGTDAILFRNAHRLFPAIACYSPAELNTRSGT